MRSGKLRRLEVAVLFRQLASTLRSGVPLPQSLSFLAEEFAPKVATRISAARQRVEGGEPLSAAFAGLPGVEPEACAALAAGERAGRLEDVLDALAAEEERRIGVGNRVRSVMLYPLAVLLLTCGALTVLTANVLPVFGSLFHGVKAALPWSTALVGGVWGVLGLPITLLLMGLFLWQMRAGATGALPRLPRVLDRIAARLPLVRSLRRTAAEGRFARLLALLLEAGVALPEALELCAAAAGDDGLSRELSAAAERVRKGETPSAALAGLSFLSPAFSWFLTGTEERGDFLEVTRAMAETADERLTVQLELLQRVLEPASIAFLGLVVGFVVVSFYLPMFELVGHVGV